ncbi:MAG: cytochrome c [Devosiaceae bacterium]|nr:cytochrome c [Devosiaceae bacterium]
MNNKKKIIPIALAVLGLGFATYALADPKHSNKDSAPKAMGMQSDEEFSPLTPKEKLTGEGVIVLSERLVLPKMDPARGKELFANKGCVMCHSVNGVGSEEAAAFDVSLMDEKMNPFDFAAKIIKATPVMTIVQENELGAPVLFSGDELLDIIAFLHSAKEQKTFSLDDLSHEMQEMLEAHG